MKYNFLWLIGIILIVILVFGFYGKDIFQLFDFNKNSNDLYFKDLKVDILEVGNGTAVRPIYFQEYVYDFNYILLNITNTDNKVNYVTIHKFGVSFNDNSQYILENNLGKVNDIFIGTNSNGERIPCNDIKVFQLMPNISQKIAICFNKSNFEFVNLYLSFLYGENNTGYEFGQMLGSSTVDPKNARWINITQTFNSIEFNGK